MGEMKTLPVSTRNLTKEQLRVVEGLLPGGKEFKKSLDDIAKMTGYRKRWIRRIINSVNNNMKSDIYIASMPSEKGYWISIDTEELKKVFYVKYSYITSLIRSTQKIKRLLTRIEGQQVLEELRQRKISD